MYRQNTQQPMGKNMGLAFFTYGKRPRDVDKGYLIGKIHKKRT